MVAVTEAMQRDRDRISARIERLPPSKLFVKLRLIIGAALFFDAFDALAIAFVLPALIGQWKISGPQIGLLFSIPYIGQFLGAVFFGWLAERIGRVRSTVYTVVIFSIMGLACAFAQSYEMMVVFRLIQGIGLGGEIPVAGTYISEFSRSDKRGRFFMMYQLVFSVGIVAAALTSTIVVPLFGWQWVFVIGAIPGFGMIYLRMMLPESPRWLASRGRIAEAEAVLADVERKIEAETGNKLPEPDLKAYQPPPEASTNWRELIGPVYRGRTFTVWALFVVTFIVAYGFVNWMPSLYYSVYKVSVQTALIYGLISSGAALIGNITGALLIDSVGRRTWFTVAYLGGSIPFVILALVPFDTPIPVLIFGCIGYAFIASLTNALYLYTPELYPTRVRALGTGLATGWIRIASVVSPYVVGAIVPSYGIQGVFLFFAIASVAGIPIVLLFALETKERVLEELSP